MDIRAYKQMSEVEEFHWWHAGKRLIIGNLLKKFLNKKIVKALDIGCGTGFNLVWLQQFSTDVCGLEFSDEAIKFAKRRSPSLSIFKSRFPEDNISDKFDLITMLDVLEHIDNEKDSIKKLNDLTKKDGLVVITIPAFNFLWSEHDSLLQHKRRYTIGKLKQIFKNSGLKIEFISYYNAILFLPILIYRLFKNLFNIKFGLADDFMPNKYLNKILGFIFYLESLALNFIKLPCGVSIICVLKKEEKHRSEE